MIALSTNDDDRSYIDDNIDNDQIVHSLAIYVRCSKFPHGRTDEQGDSRSWIYLQFLTA